MIREVMKMILVVRVKTHRTQRRKKWIQALLMLNLAKMQEVMKMMQEVMKMILAVRKRAHQTKKRIKWIQALSMQKIAKIQEVMMTRAVKKNLSQKKPKLASNDAVKDQKPPMIPKPGSE